MRWKAVLLAGSIAPLTGCILGESAARNIINEPGQFIDDKRIRHDTHTEAQRVWASICQQHPPETFSKDYEKGFTAGYTDYLDKGGPGVPPAIPPKEYRRSGYLNPEGHARTRDWFAGFQYGIDVAKDSGKRGYLTVPILLPETQQPQALNVKQIPRDVGAGEQIPKPKIVDPGTGLPMPMRPDTMLPGSLDLKGLQDLKPKTFPEPKPMNPDVKPMPPMTPGPGSAMIAPVPPSEVDIPAAPVSTVPIVEVSPYPPPRRESSSPGVSRIEAPQMSNVSANPKGELRTGRIEVSPVSEGLRLVVKPTREGTTNYKP